VAHRPLDVLAILQVEDPIVGVVGVLEVAVGPGHEVLAGEDLELHLEDEVLVAPAPGLVGVFGLAAVHDEHGHGLGAIVHAGHAGGLHRADDDLHAPAVGHGLGALARVGGHGDREVHPGSGHALPPARLWPLALALRGRQRQRLEFLAGETEVVRVAQAHEQAPSARTKQDGHARRRG